MRSGSVCFEPIGAVTAFGEQWHPHVESTFHFFDHKVTNGVEFVVRNG